MAYTACNLGLSCDSILGVGLVKKESFEAKKIVSQTVIKSIAV